MWFLLLRIFKLGFSAAKKHKASKNAPLDPSGYPMSAPGTTTTTISTNNNSYPPRSQAKHYLELFTHLLQLAFGLTVLALYGHHIHTLHKAQHSAPPKFIYAIVAALLGCCTALVYLVLMQYVLKTRVPVARRERWQLPMFVWEVVLCVVWLTLFGIFGAEFLSKGDSEDGEVVRMRRAVWVDLVNLGLWVFTASWKGFRWYSNLNRAGGGQEDQGGEKEVESV
ncbi:MARVEL domain-containing protein [Aspergillus homomorphus CBS 101889]|uniref:MARVEL domain-containing protein n=1 Tax=Aspergillus homomorphus (strain CBS 101889) TaxID=1450537 RepID=A0A395I296_ASPHC|nr:hypothetical protein BO97DRAFT_52063 [Aspergillus homomorphus CBS 101889]RAL12684.1 hypothetical protein BO97DRAFT_52063 [Aspergillus homomorphus CBS 101889]